MHCVAYSNTVEIFFTQQDQLQTVKSLHHDYITIVLTIVDIWAKYRIPRYEISWDLRYNCEPTTCSLHSLYRNLLHLPSPATYSLKLVAYTICVENSFAQQPSYIQFLEIGRGGNSKELGTLG